METPTPELIEKDLFFSFLLEHPLFSSSKINQDELYQYNDIRFFRGGDIVIREQENDPPFYILYSGRLRAFSISSNGKNFIRNLVGDFLPKEILGGVSVITKKPSAVEIVAVRDSLLLEIDKKFLERFLFENPEKIAYLARLSIENVVLWSSPHPRLSSIYTIAILPAGDTDHRLFAQMFAKELEHFGKIEVLDSLKIAHDLGIPVEETRLSHDKIHPISNSISEMESEGKRVVFIADHFMNYWTKLCIRQADLVFLVGEFGKNHHLNTVEESLFSRTQRETLPRVELILLHDESTLLIQNTSRWLQNRTIKNHYHLRKNNRKSAWKMARITSGYGIGAVFSGGLIRGLGHIGVLRAFEEEQIPIDYLGGASMGAAIAGWYARFGEHALERVFEMEPPPRSIISDYTIPIVSVFKGKNFTDYCKRFFGDSCIEDLWIPIFVVSTDITDASLYLHQRGYLWKAVRASSSIPGLFPPLNDERGHILVDGGVMNNLPIEIMRQGMHGGQIFAIDCNATSHGKAIQRVEQEWVSGFDLLLQKLDPREKKETYRPLSEIMTYALTVHSEKQLKSSVIDADYFLPLDLELYGPLEFERAVEVYDEGYKQTKKLLEQIKPSLDMKYLTIPPS